MLYSFSRNTARNLSLGHAAGAHDHRPRPFFFLDLRFQHDRRRAGDAAILTNAPEMHAHEDRGNKRNVDAMPDIGTQQGVRVYDGTAEQGKTDVVVWRHTEQRSK